MNRFTRATSLLSLILVFIAIICSPAVGAATTVATPTFSLAAGSYTGTQSVTLSDATSGATIYYTTNGTTPSSSSTKYTVAISVSASETVEAIAELSGDTNSAVASAAYTITVPTPTFSPAAGSYTGSQTVTISDSNSAATIYYTTNGTTPTTSSTKYTSAITVSASETLEAIATASGDTNSAVAKAVYTIVTPTPTFSVAAGTYGSSQSVSISDSNSAATIYYTTNGTTPSTSSTKYTSAITVNSTETLEAIAVASGDTNSAVATAAYTFVAPAPTFSLVGGSYFGPQTISISDSNSAATIYYTTNGTTPTTSSTKYMSAISVGSTETLEAIAVITGYTNSAAAKATYTITTTPGTLNIYLSPPAAQSTTVTGAITETFDALTASSTAYTTPYTSVAGIGTYTGSSTDPYAIVAPNEYGGATDSSHPATTTNYFAVGSESGSANPVTLTLTQPVSYFGFWWSAGDANNRIALYSGNSLYGTFSTADLLRFLNNGTGTITATNGTAYQTSAYFGNPNLTSGNDSAEPFAYVSFAITGATITQIVFYNTTTTTGFESDNHSVIYNGNTVTIPTTFVPVESLTLGSQVVTPVFSPAAGTYTTPQTVTISSSTPGASINYTTNGTAPTSTGGAGITVCGTPCSVPVAVTETLEAIAYETGMTNSPVASAAYTIPPSFTLTTSASTLSIVQGSNGTDTITVVPANGFTGSVTLAASGLPTGVTAAFATNPTTGTSVLTLSASSTATVGTATVTVTGTSGSLTATKTIALTVTAPPSFTLTTSASTLSIIQGSNGTDTIAVVPANGYTGSVTLAASGLPTGVTAAFATNPTTGTSVLALTASGTATLGASTVTVTGTSGSLTASATIALTVTVPPCTAIGYSFERAIVIDHTQVQNTDQSNFPVLISGTYPFLATVPNGQLQNANGYDIIFTSDAAGQNMLSYEIDSYSAATGTAAYWVLLPSLSHTTDTTIYMWYGNPSVTESQENKTAVWSNGYGAVWHFGTPTTLSTADSTANANNGINNGVVPTTGIVGGAGIFNGTGNTYLDIPSSTSFKPANALTIEAWANITGTTNWPAIVSLDYSGYGNWNSPWASYLIALDSNTLQPYFGTAASGDETTILDSGSIPANQWTHVVGTFDGSNLNFYVNGALVTTGPQSGPIDYGNSRDLSIGTNSPYNSSQAVSGLIDEVRISSVARSADWIATEYNNQSSPSTFYSVSNDEVAVIPAPAFLYASQTQQFTAVLMNSCPGAVTWSAAPSGLGILTSTGFYTAPASITSQQPVTITAASQANSALSGSATVWLLPASATGPAGTLFTIAGPGFGSAEGSSSVTVGGLPAVTLAWSDAQIQIQIPTGTGTGYQNVVVTVGGQVIANVWFDVTPGLVGIPSSAAIGASVSINAYGQQAPLIFNGAQGQEASVLFNYGAFNFYGSGGANVTLLSPNGTTLASTNVFQRGFGWFNMFENPVTLPQTGIYTVMIAPQEPTTGFADFTLFLFNDEVGTITSGTPVQVATLPGQNDFLTFSGTAGKLMSIQLSNYGFGGIPNAPVNVSILTPNGTPLGPYGLSGTNLYLSPVTLPTTGTYTLKISPQNGLSGSATVTMWLFDNLVGTITPGVPVPITINIPGQQEFLTFSGSTDQTASMQYGNYTFTDGFANLDATIVNPDGTTLVSSSLCNRGLSCLNLSINPTTLQEIGTYTLQLSPEMGVTGNATALLTLTGPPNPVTMNVDLAPSKSVLGNPVVVDVALTSKNGAVPEGSVSCSSPGVLSSAPVSSTGTAILELNGLPLGTDPIACSFISTNVSTFLNAVSATVTESVSAAGTVSVTPSSALLYAGQTQQFLASVAGAGNQGVNWTITPATGAGTISTTSGLYTAPATISSQQTVIVTATSQAYPTQSAFATITLSPTTCGSNGYSYERPIVIDHTKVPNTDQASFPFLFNTTDPLLASTANSGHVTSPNGYDIIFTSDAAGNNILPFEQESYISATGTAIYWINVPTVSHIQDTVIYMWYGNANVTISTAQPHSVWDSNFEGVWHLPNGTALSANDSTANGNNGTNYGTVAAAGEIDGGASFNGNGSYINVGNLGSFPAQGAIEFWTQASSASSYPNALTTNYNGQNNAIRFEEDSSGDFDAVIGNGSFNAYPLLSGAMHAQTWYHIALTWNTTTLTAIGYVNGAQVFDTNSSNLWPSTISDLAIGSGYDTTRYWNGLLDEVRISTAARSADWIATEYNNESSPWSFYTLGSENGIAITPASVNLYAGQSQQFSAATACGIPANWSMSSGAQGTLTASGLYTAPASITTQQTVTIMGTRQGTPSYSGTALVTLLPTPVHPTITLNAAAQPPYVTGTTLTLAVTLKTREGVPIPDEPVTFTVAGANSTSGTSVTDADGVATYTYTGAIGGSDTISATANINGEQVTSNSVSVVWIVPTVPISTSTITGAFYTTESPYSFFPSEVPVFVQTFPSIDFDPPAGTIPGTPTGIDNNARPFTEVVTDANGNFQSAIAVEGNGYQAGVGPLFEFQGVFTGSFVVPSAGNVVFNYYDDDHFQLGIGNGATAESTSRVTLPSLTTFEQLPTMGGDALSSQGAPPIIVNFPAPGTYPFEIDYYECCGSSLGMVLTSSGPSPVGIPLTGSLTLSPTSVSPLPFGGQQSFTVFAANAAGVPVPNLGVSLLVTGANEITLAGVTDATGHVTFNYQDVEAGTDSVQAAAFIDGMFDHSDTVSVPWLPSPATYGTLNIGIAADSTVTLSNLLQLTGTATDSSLPSGSSPSVTWSQVSGPGTTTFSAPNQLSITATFSQPGSYVVQLSATDQYNSGAVQWPVVVTPSGGPDQGWIASPLYGSTVSGVVPIVLVPGLTLQSGGILTYYPASNPDNVVTLSSSVPTSGQIGVLDTTMLPNGSYWIQLAATDTTGDFQYSLVLVTVAGNFKPGRVTATVTDLVVPATGLAINIQRTYDSLNAGTSGDFGYGWNLGINTDLTVDPSGNVTFTLGGQRKTFYLTPQPNGFIPYDDVAFTPEPGFYGTLTDSASGCADDFDFVVPDGSLWFCVDGGQFNPPGYIYTDATGTSYTMSALGNLQSIQDRTGNGLTITANGITSTTGLSVPFVRDSNNRITKITDPQGNIYQYGYDTNGNLTSVTYPGTAGTDGCSGATPSTTTEYTYHTELLFPYNHLYKGGTDGRGCLLPTSTYFPAGATDANGNPLAGKLASVTDSLGNTTSYSYLIGSDSSGVPTDTSTTTITYPADANGNTGTETMTYDVYGMLLSSTDPLGNTTTNVYDANHNLISVTDPLGNKTTYTYDSNGNKTSSTYPATGTGHNTTSTTVYNQFSEPTQTTDELGNVRLFNYDVNFNPQTVTDSIGTLSSFLFNPNQTLQAGAIGFDIGANPAQASQFTYDSNGNMASRTDALGRTTTYTYNSLGQKTAMVTPLQNALAGGPTSTTTYTYDALGNLTQTAAPLGRTTSSTYDTNGNKLSDTDARGNVTTYAYDALNRLILTTYPDNTAASKTYDFRNNVINDTDQAGNVTHHVYDLSGRLQSVTRGYGSTTTTPVTTTYTYDNDRRKLTETDVSTGNTTTSTYDNDGRLTSVSGVGGNFTYGYDDAGNRISIADGKGQTTSFKYDARKRMVETDYPDGTSIKNFYDGPGNLTETINQDGNIIRYTYDAANQLKSVIQENSPSAAPFNTNSYGYDDLGNLTGLTDERGNTTQNAYNLLTQLTQKTLPVTTLTETHNYDYAGNLTSLVHFDGTTTTYTYDPLNRLTGRSSNSPHAEPAVSFTYTPTGKYLTSTAQDGTVHYTYDALDRLSTKQTPEGTLSYTYYSTGKVETIKSSNANGANVSYTYDALNRLSTVVDNRLTGNNTTSYAYDNASNVVTVAYPNGLTSTLTYDELNRLTELSTSGPGSQIADYKYTLGLTGNRTNATELSNRTLQWTYNGIYQLTNEAITGDPANENGSVSYTLDPVGNRTGATSTLSGLSPGYGSYNPNDQLSTETYDNNGNTTFTGGKTLGYDSENHLISMTETGTTVSLKYDAFGNRVSKTVNGVTTQYLVEDDVNPTGYPQVLDELTGPIGSGVIQRTYSYGLQRISQDQYISGWVLSYYQYDGGGSVRQLTNPVGEVTDSYDYDAFGRSFTLSGTTPNNYLYRGEQYDSDLGLYYLRARYYNPVTGRFLSRDPEDGVAHDPASLHKYLYADGDPTNAKDPGGRGAIFEYEFSIGDRNFKFAIHPGHHYWVFLGKAFWCLHIALYTWTDGSDFWEQQIPLPYCLAGRW
jgi:RHS repeat-associated protein